MKKKAQSLGVILPRYVRVAPELGLDRLFDYEIPESLAGRIELGQRLRVPWGKRDIMAYAVEFPLQPEVEKVREIGAIIGEKPLIPPGLCKLAKWMADYYACDLGAALRTILPGPVRSHEGGGKMAWWIEPVLGRAEIAEKVLTGAKSQKKAWEYLCSHGGNWLNRLVKEAGLGTAVWRALVDRGLAERLEKRFILTEEKAEAGWADAARKPSLGEEQVQSLAEYHRLPIERKAEA